MEEASIHVSLPEHMVLWGSRVICIQDLTKTLCHLGLDPDELLPQMVPNILECQRAEAALQPPTWMHQLHNLAGTILASPRRLREAISPTGRRSRKQKPSALGKASSPLSRSPGPTVSDGSSDEGSLHAPGHNGLANSETEKAAGRHDAEETGSSDSPGFTIPVGTYRSLESRAGGPGPEDRREGAASGVATGRSDSAGTAEARDDSTQVEQPVSGLGDCRLPAQPSSTSQEALSASRNSDGIAPRPPPVAAVAQATMAKQGTADCTSPRPDCSGEICTDRGEGRKKSGAGCECASLMNGVREKVVAQEAVRDGPTTPHVEANAAAQSSGPACEGGPAPPPGHSIGEAGSQPRSAGQAREREHVGTGDACGVPTPPVPSGQGHCRSPKAHRKSLDLGIPTLWDNGPSTRDRGRPELPILRRRSSFPEALADGGKQASSPPSTDACSPLGTPGSPFTGWDALASDPLHAAAGAATPATSAGVKTLEFVQHAGPPTGSLGPPGSPEGRASAHPVGTTDGGVLEEGAAGSGRVEDAGEKDGMEAGSRTTSGGDDVVENGSAPDGVHLTFAAFKRLVYRESVDGARMPPSSPASAFPAGGDQVRGRTMHSTSFMSLGMGL